MDLESKRFTSPVFRIDRLEYGGICHTDRNGIFIKRDDLIPFSFGGNKARMGRLYFDDAAEKGCGSVITTGGTNSNMCRIVANLAAQRGWPCYIILMEEYSETAGNSVLLEKILNAELIRTDVVHSFKVIRDLKEKLQNEGKNPYFIEGGGHGTLGVQACTAYYEEILEFEKAKGIHFDRIYLTVGTGTTLSGLVSAQVMYGDDTRKVTGISAAQKNPRISGLVKKSVDGFLKSRSFDYNVSELDDKLFVKDRYTFGGYGSGDDSVRDLIRAVFREQGIPLDPVYTGKGFYGMLKDLEEENVRGENVLFIHTGGTPLFFDMLNR